MFMKISELLAKGLDLASIATWITIIGVAVLAYISKAPGNKPSNHFYKENKSK